MKIHLSTFLLILSFSLLSCKKRIEPEELSKLYEKYRKSVVLIRNQYYYEIELGNGASVYFTESTNGDISDLVFKREEAIRNANTNYGTGFFISKDGKLVTNRHVVYPVIDNASILATLKIRFDNAKFMIEEIQNDLTAKISNIENYVNANYSQLDYSSIQALNEKKAQL